MITPREAVLFHVLQPPRPGGFVVVLTGDLERGRGVSGGLVLGRGAELYRDVVAHCTFDARPQNTREQALALCDLWPRQFHVTLRVSAYHAYRAFLTVLQAMLERGIADKMRVDCDVYPWAWDQPPVYGDDTRPRRELLTSEFEKVHTYRGFGHVATDEQALEYFARWTS